MLILAQVVRIREKLPGVGTGKLYHLLTRFLAEHQIKLGRDKLYDLLREHIYYALSGADGQKRPTCSILFTNMLISLRSCLLAVLISIG